MEVNYSYVITGFVSFALWFIKAQMDRRYKEQEEINKQVSINSESILENKLRDEASVTAFETYKQTITKDFNNMEITLGKILEVVEELTKTVNDLKIEITKLKK